MTDLEREGDEREHELGNGGQQRREVTGHPGSENAGGTHRPVDQPPDGQPNDAASELGGQTMSQAEQERAPREDGEDRNEAGHVDAPEGQGETAAELADGHGPSESRGDLPSIESDEVDEHSGDQG